MTIVLATLNARYTHASLGLRYLLANMGELQADTRLCEFVIGARTTEVVEKLLAHEPDVIGLGVYIWNAEESAKLVATLKRVAPQVTVVLGGPEVSHEPEQQAIMAAADYLITGWGEVSFPALCRQLKSGHRPAGKIQAGEQAPLDRLALPYALYDAHDIAHRTLYVEASRGCPFKCEFCLSSLDKTAWPFELERFLAELEALYARGARRFKFVDRTFNLNAKTGVRIMQFMLGKIALAPHDPVFAHFEVVPDHLPDTLKEQIVKFPHGTLQFEIGIQTFNPDVQALISRRQDDAKSEANLRWLRRHSNAHLHVDLIAGLPGEDIDSFARGFDRLLELEPHEIQFGILKRLRGTPVIRHTEAHGLRFDPYPPYTILATDCIAFPDMQRLVRFARYWDLIANSGRFARTLALIMAHGPGPRRFDSFMALSDWLYRHAGGSSGIALDRLAGLVRQWLLLRGVPAETAEQALALDRDAGRGAAPALQRQARHA
jgi:radical SAM superfamily enzyme YgiQ (UPF0313 family)